MPVARPLMPLIKIRRNLCGYLTAGSFGCDLSYEAQKRYADTDAHHFFCSARAAYVAAVTIFLIRHLKTTYRQNYRKAFSLVFSALEFSLVSFLC